MKVVVELHVGLGVPAEAALEAGRRFARQAVEGWAHFTGATAAIVPEPCPVRSSVTAQPCVLPAGHPQDAPDRFHRYGPPERASFEQGFLDGREGLSTGLTYNGDPSGADSEAYDRGRTAGEAAAARKFDRLQHALAAAERVAGYVAERDGMRGIDRHSLGMIHGGTLREQNLWRTDLLDLVALAGALRPAEPST